MTPRTDILIHEIWNNYSMIEIQSVINPLKNEYDIENIKIIAKELNCNIRFVTGFRSFYFVDTGTNFFTISTYVIIMLFIIYRKF